MVLLQCIFGVCSRCLGLTLLFLLLLLLVLFGVLSSLAYGPSVVLTAGVSVPDVFVLLSVPTVRYKACPLSSVLAIR